MQVLESANSQICKDSGLANPDSQRFILYYSTKDL